MSAYNRDRGERYSFSALDKFRFYNLPINQEIEFLSHQPLYVQCTHKQKPANDIRLVLFFIEE